MLAGMKPSLWKLIEVLTEEARDVEQQTGLIKMGQTTRVSNTKSVKAERALSTAFKEFRVRNDIKYLLRFGSKQAANLNIDAIEDGKQHSIGKLTLND